MAFNWNKFPWTNLHELNLDWIIQKVRELEIKVLDAAQTAVQYTDSKIADLLTGAGDLTINKTGDIRVTANSVQVTGGATFIDNGEPITLYDPDSKTGMTATYKSSLLYLRNNQDLNRGAAVYNVRTPEVGEYSEEFYPHNNFAASVGYVKTAVSAVSEANGLVLRGTATFNADGRITEVDGVDFSSVAAAALANVNILLVLTASNVGETYMVMRYVGKKQLATSGANRYRYTFIGSNSISGSLEGSPYTGNVYGLDFNEGDDPMREKNTYFISRGVCDFHVTGTALPDGSLQSVTFKAGYSKADFDNLLAQGARVRLVVEITGETRYFEMCYTTNGVTAFGGMYIDNNESANIEIVSYNGTTFFIKGLATYGGEIV